MRRLVLLSVLVGTSVWFEQSTFVPFASDRAIGYVLCTPPVWLLLGEIVLVAAILGGWWQGRGMDMDGVQDASDIPASKQGPRFLRNFSNLVPAIERDVSQLLSDASYLGNSKHWGHQFNKATYVGNWFVTGKNGGLYQMHQPGVSIVMLPPT